MMKVPYEEVRAYKEAKANTFKDGKKRVQGFVNWLKEKGYSDTVELELNRDNLPKCMHDYFLVLNSVDELSVMDRLESGYSVRRNNVTLGIRALFDDEQGDSKAIVPYSKEYERIIELDNLESLLLELN